MPRRSKRKSKRKSDDVLSAQDYIALCIGPSHMASDIGAETERLRARWAVHSAGLMDRWHETADPRYPSRPWGWWAFVAGRPMPLGLREEAEELARLAEHDPSQEGHA